jgi:hypothetical protein
MIQLHYLYSLRWQLLPFVRSINGGWSKLGISNSIKFEAKWQRYNFANDNDFDIKLM